jgi:hypothetical protein
VETDNGILSVTEGIKGNFKITFEYSGGDTVCGDVTSGNTVCGDITPGKQLYTYCYIVSLPACQTRSCQQNQTMNADKHYLLSTQTATTLLSVPNGHTKPQRFTRPHKRIVERRKNYLTPHVNLIKVGKFSL